MPTLDWLNRATAFTTAARVPYRLLEQVSIHTGTVPPEPASVWAKPAEAPAQADLLAAVSHHVRPKAVKGPAPFHDNLLIQGDNLEALKALLPFYRGQVKCIFIDPPYNTKSAFEHYDDNLEHAQWLSMMLPRLQLLRELLREDGSIWVTIDDNEGHYLKVLMDEVFGRGNFVANVVWQKKYAVANDHKTIAPMHDHLLVYRQSAHWQRNLIQRSDSKDAQYKYADDRGVYRVSDYTCSKTADERPNLYYPVRNPNTEEEVWPKKTRVWAYSLDEYERHAKEGFIFWGKDGKGRVPSFKRYLHLLKQTGIVPQTIWEHTFAGHTDSARKEAREVLGTTNLNDDFLTPKPELLISKVIEIATNPNDLILDSFLGSGTTAAVAHKMGRRWIGIEMGDHAATHCLPRLQKVIDGEQGGISKAVGWGQGKDGEPFQGGGFRFMRLGPTVFDESGRIHPAVRFATLAAFIWQQETGAAWPASGPPGHPAGAKAGTPYLGAYYANSSELSNNHETYLPISPINVPKEPLTTPIIPKMGIYLLFNGILGDKRPASGNVLTHAVLDALLALHATTPAASAPLLVYGEACRLGEERLKQANVSFKHIPYDVRAR